MFKNPFSFDGRIQRLEYSLIHFMFVALCFLTQLYAELEEFSEQLVSTLIYMSLFRFLLAQGAKR